jgi:hypothetical protein
LLETLHETLQAKVSSPERRTSRTGLAAPT